MPETRRIFQSIDPVACVKCGSMDSLSPRAYEKTYTPKWVYFGLLGGLLPLAILMLIANKKHRITVFFCTACWKRYSKTKIVSNLLAISCLLFLLLGPALGLAYESWFIAIASVAMAIAIAVFMDRHMRAASPRCVLLNREKIVLDIPGHGNIEMAKSKA